MNDRSLNDNELTRHRIDIASGLFAAWSAGDADAPEPFWAPDGVLEDVASGTFEGWPAIRGVLRQWPHQNGESLAGPR